MNVGLLTKRINMLCDAMLVKAVLPDGKKIELSTQQCVDNGNYYMFAKTENKNQNIQQTIGVLKRNLIEEASKTYWNTNGNIFSECESDFLYCDICVVTDNSATCYSVYKFVVENNVIYLMCDKVKTMENNISTTKKRIVFATGNKSKEKEIKKIMSDIDMEIVTMKDAGIQIDIEENGVTYEENALIKARAVANYTNDIVMADDSGLEIDYLNNEPGIYSARYLGEKTPQKVKNDDLLRRLEGVPQEERKGRYVCAIAVVLPSGEEFTVRATMEGYIVEEEKGSNGFGYDPIFYIPQFGRTVAELTEEEKNEASHRGKALQLAKDLLHNI
jgi:XTP/dITP diphosphohydrolase